MLEQPCRLAVVVPVYGNEQSLETLYERIVASTSNLGVQLTIQFVNDRSPDNSQAVLEQLAARDARVGVLLLSKNHGSFTAIAAGLAQVADHDAVVVMSADLQDPPETIPEMVALWRSGKRVVLATRRARADSALSVFFADLFYRLFRMFVSKDMPKRGFDYFLVDKCVVQVILTSSEKKTSLIGLVLWAGFERGVIEYDRCVRPHGKSMWTFTKKLSYAFQSVVAFSSYPFKFMFCLGLIASAASLLSIMYVFYSFWNNLISIPGWTSLVILQLITITVLFISFGILGGYLWITLEQTRKRPLYIVDRKILPRQHPGTQHSGCVDFFNIQSVSAGLEASLLAGAKRVLASDQIILGQEVRNFEEKFASYIGTKHAVGVASGADAITIALWVSGVQPGDRVIVPALTAVPTAVSVLRAGAIPVWADIDPKTLLISPEAVARCAAQGAKAIIPVHLYGNVCLLDELSDIARTHGLVMVEDCAQSTGSTHKGAGCGSFGAASAFSFYPTKNLGAYGDGGAVLTNSAEAYAAALEARFYGQASSGECVRLGMNSRLDEVQAAFLLERMKVLHLHNIERIGIADKYDEHLQHLNPVPRSAGSVPHLYVVQVARRAEFRDFLHNRGVKTGVHYPLALNRHRFLAQHSLGGDCPVAEAACQQIVSLPCYPGMPSQEVERVIEVCKAWNHA